MFRPAEQADVVGCLPAQLLALPNQSEKIDKAHLFKSTQSL